jgi:two-component system CheB/CheR fusion protein
MEEEIGILHLVVIGASAGGIDALSTLVSTLPVPFPAPVVLAQHLDPGRISHLANILARRSTLPIREVIDQTPLENGVVFVIPANRHVEVTDHMIAPRFHDGRTTPSIDLLLSSAAEVYGENLVAVILTGTGTDGAAGVQAVKESGGTVVIQNPSTAQFPGMPGAIAPTLVDVVAEIEAIGPLLRDLITGTYMPVQPAENPTMRTLLEQLHEATGIDFSNYKMPTIQRRLQRRMAATGIRRLSEYVQYLQSNPEEYERLVRTFLIKVTEFFRDAELFDFLRLQILPELITYARGHDYELRLWSAGCATGEEAYSLAILVAETLGNELERFVVRIFATDLDVAAVTFARRGLYPASAVAGVPPDLRDRYFTPLDGAFEVSKRVRGLVVFGEHDLGQRAPFPRIDLCLCRNVLIYFTTDLQDRALKLFAFAVRDGGYLGLGKAEAPTSLGEYFVPLQPHLRLYRRQGGRLLLPVVPLREQATHRIEPSAAGRQARARRLEASPSGRETPRPRARTEAAVLLRHLPVGVVVVDRHYDIQSINTAAQRLLAIPGPALGEDLIHLLDRLPAPRLRPALDAVLAGGEARTQILEIETVQGSRRILQLTCYGQSSGDEDTEPAEPRVVMLVNDITAMEEARRANDAAHEREIASLKDAEAHLRSDVARLDASLNRVVAVNTELEAANARLTGINADLRSANEEFQVDTEEMQAAMEEVETLNEEMQATNEELETLNEELQATVEELNTTNDDLEARNHEMQTLAMEREAQRQSSEAERARLATILSSMADAVLVVDRTGAVVLSNQALNHVFGPDDSDIVPEDTEGRPLPREQTPRARAAQGDIFRMTFTLPGPDGGRRWFEATGGPVVTEGNASQGIVVIRDITDLSLRRLSEQFVALTGHELRTPLTVIVGYLQLLQRRLLASDANEEVQHFLSAALGQFRNLQRLIDELLDLGRIQEGKLTLVNAAVDLTLLVRAMVEAVQVSTPQPPIHLELPSEPLVVWGDGARLGQVVLNLLNNATHHAASSPQITVRLWQEAGQAVLEVADQGPGIAASSLPHLFERLYQAASAHEQPGLGVGLYIAHELVQAHGGTIDVQSVEGQGATFSVRLPVREQATLASDGESPVQT